MTRRLFVVVVVLLFEEQLLLQLRQKLLQCGFAPVPLLLLALVVGLRVRESRSQCRHSGRVRRFPLLQRFRVLLLHAGHFLLGALPFLLARHRLRLLCIFFLQPGRLLHLQRLLLESLGVLFTLSSVDFQLFRICCFQLLYLLLKLLNLLVLQSTIFLPNFDLLFFLFNDLACC